MAIFCFIRVQFGLITQMMNKNLSVLSLRYLNLIVFAHNQKHWMRMMNCNFQKFMNEVILTLELILVFFRFS